MYDEEPGDGWQRRGPSMGSVVLVSIIVSSLTSGGVVLGLRLAEKRGWFAGEPAQVPDVVNMNLAQAREVVAARGFLLTLGSERSDAQVPAGAIIEQSPLPGSAVTPGSNITAVVSTGAVKVPAVAGMSPEDAGAKLKQAGLQTGTQRNKPSSTVPVGTVIASQPPEGAGVKAGEQVELIVSSGPEGTQVPKVVGLRISKAQQVLKAAGFEVGKTRYGYSDYSDASMVLKQTPEAGELATPGTAVDLVVNEPD